MVQGMIASSPKYLFVVACDIPVGVGDDLLSYRPWLSWLYDNFICLMYVD